MINLWNRQLNATGIGVLIIAAVISCGMGGRPSPKNTPLSLKSLYSTYRIPSICGVAPDWDGQTVTIKGYLDLNNIFDKQRYPRLVYEKFKVLDRQGRSIEVWVDVADSRAVFSALSQKRNSQVVIRGRLAAVEMPIAGQCLLGAKVWINDSSQIQ